MNLSPYLAASILVALTARGAEPASIKLTADDQRRLGVVFAPVAANAAGAGPRYPATVTAPPDEVALLTAPFAGVVEKWLVAPGDQVRAGQSLASLRSPEALRLQQEWMAAVAAEEAARAEAAKVERLFAEGIVSAQRVAVARRAHEQAMFTRRAAEAVLRRVGFTEERFAALRRGAEEPGVYQLLAASDGQVARRLVAAGEFAEARTPLIRMRANGASWVSIQVPARVAAGLQPGQTFRLLPGGGELLLRQRDRGVEDRSQSVLLLAEARAENSLLPGQVVSVELSPPPGGLLVPGSAVVHRGDETSVFVRSTEGIRPRVVTLQPMGADYLVVAGLSAGEELAVRGAAVLKGIEAGLGRPE